MTGFDGNSYRKEVLKPLLDAGEHAVSDPFAILGLDPGVDDDELIRTRVTEVVAFWRKEQSSPRYKGLVSSLLKQQDAISMQMLDRGRRAEARVRVQGATATADAEAAAKVDELLDTLERRHGGIPRDRLDRLRSLASTMGITAEQIDARLAERTILDAAATAIEPIAAPTRRQVASLLVELARLDPDAGTHRTLYGFLGLPVGADASAVASRRDAIDARNRQRRHDRLRTVVDELLALSETLLVTGDPRRYLAGVEEDVRDEVRPAIETAVLLEDKVSAAETDRLTREAVSAGLDPTAARDLVIEVARSLSAPIDVGAAPDYVVCAACNAANVAPEGARTAECARCGAELHRPCPRCGRTVARSDVRCAGCRFDLRACDEAAEDLARAADDLDAGRLAAAEARVEAAAAWGDDLPDLVHLRDRVAAAARTAEDAWDNLAAALSDGRVDDARRYVAAVGRVASDRPGPDGTEVAAAVARVEDLEADVARAVAEAAATGDGREAALLAVHERFPGASAVAEALADVEVQPAADVTATTEGSVVRIRWAPSASPGPVEYRIERTVERTGGATTPLGRVAATEIDDGGAPAGAPLRYAVVAARLGITAPAATSAPLVHAPEVADLEAVEHDGAIELRWRAVRAGEVWVERTEVGDPTVPRRSLRGGPTGVLDTAVRAGTRYAYRVGVQHPGGAGAEPLRTAGREVEAVAFALPAPPPIPTVTPNGRSITVSVPRPSDGVEAVVLRAREAPPAGAVLDEAGLRAVGGALAGRDGTGYDAADGGPRWYVAAHVVRGHAVLGEAVVHPGVGEVERVRVEADAKGLVVRWDWPEACTEAVIHWSRDTREVVPGAPGTAEARTTNTAYEVNGGWRPGVPSGPVSVLVLAAGRVAGERVAVPGWSAAARASGPD